MVGLDYSFCLINSIILIVSFFYLLFKVGPLLDRHDVQGNKESHKTNYCTLLY